MADQELYQENMILSAQFNKKGGDYFVLGTTGPNSIQMYSRISSNYYFNLNVATSEEEKEKILLNYTYFDKVEYEDNSILSIDFSNDSNYFAFGGSNGIAGVVEIV